MTLYRYKPTAEAEGLDPGADRLRPDRPLHHGRPAGRPLAGAQPARSGVDLYVVDWGNPSRGDRWLTLDDYVDGYLDDCVDFIREQHGIDKVNLLGICEGGVFTLCYAALHPETVKNLVLTITPVDFHADATRAAAATASSTCGRAA